MNPENETTNTTETQPEWAIVDLLGHTRFAGRLSEETRFGVVLGRCDVPTDNEGGFATRLFSGASVYSVTICSEEVARAVALPRPARRYEMPALQSGVEDEPDDDPDDLGHDDYDDRNPFGED